jgi:hypothetical protein
MVSFPRHATAIALMTLDLAPLPTPRLHTPFADKLLVGAGLITHHIGNDDRLHLQLRTCVSKTLTNESTILDWLEDELAAGEPLIGYELRNRLVPFLTEKAGCGDFPTISSRETAMDWRSVDLVEMSADNEIVPLAIACAAHGIPVPAWDWHLGQSGWMPALTKALGGRAAVNVVATWRLWVERYGAALDTAGLLAPHLRDIDIWLANSASHNLV